MTSTDEKIKQVCDFVSMLLEDSAIPRNIRKSVSDARDRMIAEKQNPEVAVASMIYVMEEVSNDINMPLHARTDIWNIISALERVKEELKSK